MKQKSTLTVTVFAAVVAILAADASGPRDGQTIAGLGSPAAAASLDANPVARADDGVAATYIEVRKNDDLSAMQTFRPGYGFWQNIFTIPDGSIAFGSAVDGRLLAVFPTHGDW